jgi:flagellin-like protein
VDGQRNLKNFMRNLRGLSPIFATLILVSIVVIASTVVYMFTSGTFATMTDNGSVATERVSVCCTAPLKLNILFF